MLLTIDLAPDVFKRVNALPDDDLTQEWLKAIEEYRRECDQELPYPWTSDSHPTSP